MPVSYSFVGNAASVTLDGMIEPQSLSVVQRMLNAGEVSHIGFGDIDPGIVSSLDLTNVRSVDIGSLLCHDLGFLASVKRLESLRISYMQKPQVGKNVRLDTIPSSNSLMSLTLRGVRRLKTLPQFPGLRTLNLNGIKEDLGFLSVYPALSDLWISESSAEGLTQVLHCKRLVRLRMIQVSKIDFPGWVADGTINNSLKILEISYCRDLRQFDFLQQFPSLKYMDITSCRNIASFEGIEKCTQLEVINVSECRVADKNLQYLLDIDNVMIGMVYSKKEIDEFAKAFKGKVFYINRVEKGYLNYGDFYTKYYGGNIDAVI